MGEIIDSRKNTQKWCSNDGSAGDLRGEFKLGIAQTVQN